MGEALEGIRGRLGAGERLGELGVDDPEMSVLVRDLPRHPLQAVPQSGLHRLQRGPPSASAQVRLYGSREIRDGAQERGADLIVMGTRGLTGLKHVMLGSVAERTIRIAPCPVLTIKAEQPE